MRSATELPQFSAEIPGDGRWSQVEAAKGRGALDFVSAADQVMGDPDRLEQVIENLFANAVCHAPDGSTVELRAEGAGGAVRLSVTDQGSGIAPDYLPHVFDRFYKVDAGRAAGDGRSGLGLSIVKAIVERHGGAVSVTSVPGRTEFAVDLPRPSTC